MSDDLCQNMRVVAERAVELHLRIGLWLLATIGPVLGELVLDLAALMPGDNDWERVDALVLTLYGAVVAMVLGVGLSVGALAVATLAG